jgi:hypothetical protein
MYTRIPPVIKNENFPNVYGSSNSFLHYFMNPSWEKNVQKGA